MANHYDKIIKEIMDSVYLSLSKKFIDKNFSKTEELGTDIQKTIEKKTDFLRKVQCDNPKDNFILHAEAQNRDDPEMIYRMIEYFGMLLRKYQLPVVQYVFYFGKGISSMKNVYQVGKITYSYELVSIQEFSYKEFIITDKPDELVLTILSDFEDKSKEEIAKMIFSRAKELIIETNQMGKFVNQIEVLSKLRNLDNFIQEFTQNTMALDLKLEDTFTYKQGLKQGESKGEKKNRDKMILSLYKNTKLGIQKIALTADVSEQYVIDLLKAENITIEVSENKKVSKSKGKK